MKKSIRNFCSGDASTSTLNQQYYYNTTQAQAAQAQDHDNHDVDEFPNESYSSISAGKGSGSASAPTLEEMILKLEREEENARQAKLIKTCKGRMARMSCVNNSDIGILMSARNALNQYPRFSLDGKDAMYRSSFRNSDNSRKSVCCDYGGSSRNHYHYHYWDESKFLLDINYKPSSSSMAASKSLLGGRERVVEWCKPGVVAKLMGLDAMPVPVKCSSNALDNIGTKKNYLSSSVSISKLKRQNLRREIQRRILTMDISETNETTTTTDRDHQGTNTTERLQQASNSTSAACCVMNCQQMTEPRARSRTHHLL